MEQIDVRRLGYWKDLCIDLLCGLVVLACTLGLLALLAAVVFAAGQ